MEHSSSREHQLLQPWLVLPVPVQAALPWAPGLSSRAEALPANPNAQGENYASLVPGYFFAHF